MSTRRPELQQKSTWAHSHRHSLSGRTPAGRTARPGSRPCRPDSALHLRTAGSRAGRGTGKPCGLRVLLSLSGSQPCPAPPANTERPEDSGSSPGWPSSCAHTPGTHCPPPLKVSPAASPAPEPRQAPRAEEGALGDSLSASSSGGKCDFPETLRSMGE